MSVRPATHAGTWYHSSKNKLDHQIHKFIQSAENSKVKGARILIGPHAGYSYSGLQLAETFKAWDPEGAGRIFLLGPSHHVFFDNKVLLSQYSAYETPFGDLRVDTKTVDTLKKDALFKFMSSSVDQDEHSFEMHAPFIKRRLQEENIDVGIIPILFCDLDDEHMDKLADILLPYLEDPKNHFIISSDFCHWGKRFGYTEYAFKAVEEGTIAKDDLVTLKTGMEIPGKIYKSIELLDSVAMEIAANGNYEDWVKYIQTTGNTICGQKPIAAVLLMLDKFGIDEKFKWIGYSQSSRALKISDSSVSYASGYVVLD